MKEMGLTSRGDTIVEVLISIAIVGAVLAGAFVSASRSLTATRQSQERGEALKLVEGQLERLKSLADTNTPPSVYSVSSPFCITDTNAFNTSPPCTITTLGVRYDLTVERSGNTFSVFADWDKAGGNGREQVKITYKIYPL